MKKKLISTLVCSTMLLPAFAQKAYEPIELFPREMMKATELKEKETVENRPNDNSDKTTAIRSNVSFPSLTYYPAEQGTATGAAMIVCPGGGYFILADDLEGTEICQWLNANGITAILLRYRVPRREGLAKNALALQDAQRAVSYVRYHAKEWGINPAQIGIMGFSAGGHLSASTSTNFATRTYTAFDDVDQVSCRPDYTLLVYPAYLAGEDVKEPSLRSAPELPISKETPPCMIIQAENDHPFIDGSLVYYYNLMQNNVPATMHLYPEGGHGYGLRPSQHAVCEWPKRAEDWFKQLGLTKSPAPGVRPLP